MNFPRLYTRRQQLRLLVPAFAGGLMLPGIASSEEVNSPGKGFRFFAINDLHFLEEACRPFFSDVVAAMKLSAPDAAFCLICGDISDKGTPEQIGAIRDIFGKLEMPLHVVPGNHDYLTQKDRSGYDAIFPGKLNYQFEYEGWRFLGLDTTEGVKYNQTVIAAETLAWVDEQSALLDKKQPTVVFTHFPLGEGVTYRPTNAGVLLEKLLKLNLRGVFSGHWHGASERLVGEASIVTDRCCSRVRDNADGSPLKGWFVCEATRAGVLSHAFVKAPGIKPVG
ncbi:MAG: metallophosphoesterase [Chthoniobacteraceae bacterium]|nr:metallophosphoesterase [Chthoniobacteraceae bacterium]